MKTIGLLGGMSWTSTLSYYQYLNEITAIKLGGLHSAPLCLYSVDFAEIERLQHQQQWQQITKVLISGCQRLVAAGAEFILICTNTMHCLYEPIQQMISVPILHITDAIAQQLLQDHCLSIGLLGTKFTMQQEFYRERLEQVGIQVFIPELTEQEVIHNIIYNELCKNKILTTSKQVLVNMITQLKSSGAQGIILGCTELALLINQKESPLPLYDSCYFHAQRAIEYALEE